MLLHSPTSIIVVPNPSGQRELRDRCDRSEHAHKKSKRDTEFI